MKLITGFLILIAVQACLILYAGQTPESTDIWTFVTTIDNWNSLQFILSLAAIASAIGLVGFASGSIFGFKTDFLIMAAAIAGLISMGVVFVNLGNLMRDDLVARVFTSCDLNTGVNCEPVNWILAVTIGPFALLYVWTVIEWWKNKDM